jgi:hypothetical protein
MPRRSKQKYKKTHGGGDRNDAEADALKIKMQNELVKIQSDFDKLMEDTRKNDNVEHLQGKIESAISNYGIAIRAFFVVAMPYVILILVICILIGAIGAIAGIGSIGGAGMDDNHWYSPYVKPIYNFLRPGYSTIMMMRRLNGNVVLQTIPRQTILSGRCDMNTWKENPSTEGHLGTCTNPVKPDDIEWNIKASSNPELSQLPSEYKKQNAHVVADATVVMPWSTEQTFYVPDCTKAYFKNQSRPSTDGTCNENETLIDKTCYTLANLFEEHGDTCSLKEVVRDNAF